MEKASDGSFARITRKTAEDDDEDEKDWGMVLNRYQGLPWVSQENVFSPEGVRDVRMRTGPVGSRSFPHLTAPSGLIPLGRS
jgi:hypothetical protein